MKMHIDTLPLIEAYEAGGECPLCTLQKKMNDKFVDLALGGSVMESDVRTDVNARGFCQNHLGQLMAKQNVLGVSLMALSHLERLKTELYRHMPKEDENEKNARGRGVSIFKNKDKDAAKTCARVAELLSGDCYICHKLDDVMNRYYSTLLHLYKTDGAFKEMFLQSKGLCLPHYAKVMHSASERLSAGIRAEFVSNLNRLQTAALDRLYGELDYFTQKFNYLNREKPWNGTEDAPARVLLKLRRYSGD